MKAKCITGLIIIIVFFAGLFLGKRKCSVIPYSSDTVFSTKLITEIRHDTIVQYKPEPVIYTVTDTLRIYEDTVLLREQKVYKDSTYEAYVSGIDPQLDSLKQFMRTVYQTIENTKTITIHEKSRKLSLGISAGYGVTPKGLLPFLGVSVNYRIW